MKFIATAAIVLLSTTAAFASAQDEAKKELDGWSVAVAKYEQECGVGKVREQMPKEKAVHAYECFADIINKEITFQYPDLYTTLDTKMREAHHAYAEGQSWDKTIEQLGAASDVYNEAVAVRNKKAAGINED